MKKENYRELTVYAFPNSSTASTAEYICQAKTPLNA
jgi:hypothetical protein